MCQDVIAFSTQSARRPARSRLPLDHVVGCRSGREGDCLLRIVLPSFTAAMHSLTNDPINSIPFPNAASQSRPVRKRSTSSLPQCVFLVRRVPGTRPAQGFRGTVGLPRLMVSRRARLNPSSSATETDSHWFDVAIESFIHLTHRR